MTKFRILAVQADPIEIAPGESTSLRALYANPDKKEVQSLWMGFRGLIKPGFAAAAPSLEWPPQITVLGNDYTGIANYGNLFVRKDFLPDIAPNDYDKSPCAAPNKAQVTAVVLLCAGGKIDLKKLSSDAADSDTGDITSFLTSLCTGKDADSVLAFKTFMVSNLDDRKDILNINPKIELLEFDETELQPVKISGDVGVFQCEGEDGCRKPVNIRARLTDSSYSKYTKYYYDGAGNIIDCKQVNTGTYISWFADGGEFNTDRSGTGDPPGWYEVEWMPPRTGGTQYLWAVSHNIRGGVAWKLYKIEAVSPEKNN